MKRPEVLSDPNVPDPDVIRINLAEWWVYWWDIRAFGASDRANHAWDKITRITPDLTALDKKPQDIFRLFLEWEAAKSLAIEKNYPELLELYINPHYEKRFFNKVGLREEDDAEESNLARIKYTPLSNLAAYIIHRRQGNFDDPDIRDKTRLRVRTALKIFAREFPNEQNVV